MMVLLFVAASAAPMPMDQIGQMMDIDRQTCKTPDCSLDSGPRVQVPN